VSDSKALKPATEPPAASPIEASGNSFEATPTDATSPRPVFEIQTQSEVLCEHANAIRDLRKKTIESVCEIGRRLSEAKKIVGRGRWVPWLEKEFDWTDRTATNFIRVYEMVAKRNFENFSKLSLPISSLYLLAAPGTPDAVRNTMLKQAEAGQPVTGPMSRRR
jgi:hypothetical protein